jgi:hypothetical protein
MSNTTIDLTDKYQQTTLTNYEVLELGAALLSWMLTVERLGHASPASVLDYTGNTDMFDSPSPLIVRDFVAWTSGRKDVVPGCEERLRSLVAATDLEKNAVLNMAHILTASAS